MINVKNLWSEDLEHLTKIDFTHEYDYRVHAIQSSLILMFQHSQTLMSKLMHQRIEYDNLEFGFYGYETEQLCKAFSDVFNCEREFSKNFYDTVFDTLINYFGVCVFFSPFDQRIHIINITDTNNDGVLSDDDIVSDDFGDVHAYYGGNINPVNVNITFDKDYISYSSNMYDNKDLIIKRTYHDGVLNNTHNLSYKNYNVAPYMDANGNIFFPGGTVRFTNGNVKAGTGEDSGMNIFDDNDFDVTWPPEFNQGGGWIDGTGGNNNGVGNIVDDDSIIVTLPSYTPNIPPVVVIPKPNRPSDDIFDKFPSDDITSWGQTNGPNNKDFVNTLVNLMVDMNVEKDKDESWSSTSDFPIRSVGDLSFEDSNKHSAFFNSRLTNDITRKTMYDLTIVYGPNKQHYRRLVNVIPRAKSQEINSSGEAIYDIIEFIAQDVVEKK